MTSGRAGSKTQQTQPRGVGRRAIIALGGVAAGSGLATALARPAVAQAAPDATEAQAGSDDGSRLTELRAAYYRRARF